MDMPVSKEEGDPARPDDFSNLQLEMLALYASSILKRPWFGGLFSGEAAQYMPRLLFGMYLDYRNGRLSSKKGASEMLGAEHPKTTRKYLAIGESLGLIGRVSSARGKRKEWIVPTERLVSLVEEELYRLGVHATESVATLVLEPLPVRVPELRLPGPRKNWARIIENTALHNSQVLHRNLSILGWPERAESKEGVTGDVLQTRAIESLSETIEYMPDNPYAYLYRASMKMQLINRFEPPPGRLEEIVADLTETIKRKPTLDYALGRRAEAYMLLQKYDLAIADLTMAIDLSPRTAGYYEARARAYVKLRHRSKAKLYLERARKLS